MYSHTLTLSPYHSLTHTHAHSLFQGANNINLLMPNGQFGTRHQGGKDAASPRYIFTNLSPITRYIFPEIDDNLFEVKNENIYMSKRASMFSELCAWCRGTVILGSSLVVSKTFNFFSFFSLWGRERYRD